MLPNRAQSLGIRTWASLGRGTLFCCPQGLLSLCGPGPHVNPISSAQMLNQTLSDHLEQVNSVVQQGAGQSASQTPSNCVALQGAFDLSELSVGWGCEDEQGNTATPIPMLSQLLLPPEWHCPIEPAVTMAAEYLTCSQCHGGTEFLFKLESICLDSISDSICLDSSAVKHFSPGSP